MLLARRQGLLRRRPAREQGVRAERPTFSHPAFDYETRIVTAELAAHVASVYVPNGGKDFAAKMRFLEALDAFVGERTRTGSGSSSAAT